jgi:uncharacterized protein
MKLLVDQMLGTLAKWLRFFGIDTFYATQSIQDDELLEIAKKEHRVLVTRDKELILRAQKRDIRVIPVFTRDLDEQLNKVLENTNVDTTQILSRCSLCNTKLISIDKEQVKDKVPENVYQTNETFWICSNCHKIYWRGSHYDEIIQKIKSLNQ